jgi:[acyl-carrier-protein] S-malonyltransferase
MAEPTAWLFPGQGSQLVGMGKALAKRAPEAAQTFDTADRTLGFSVSRFCWEGPAEELTRTANQQPALVATSIAMQRVLSARDMVETPDLVAGHSLGEYSALVATGALALHDALRLVRRRGELMEEHGLGGMIAVIGLDDEAVQLVANETGTEVANFNSPGQVTLSGVDEALQVAELAAKTRGARSVVRLPVNGAFHSSLMLPVAQELAPMIEETSVNTPIAPLVTNVDASPVSHPDDVRSELVDQIAQAVQWVRVVEHIVGAGVNEAYEIGPGNVLAGLARRIDRSLKVTTSDTMLAELESIDD